MDRTVRRRSVLAWKCRAHWRSQATSPNSHKMNEARGGDEQQGLEALGASRARVAQCEPESVALEVANGLLDLHALGVDSLDPGAGTAVMRQRGGEQPRDVVHLSILRTTRSALARSARATTIGAHQIQSAPVPMPARQTSPADMAHPGGGL